MKANAPERLYLSKNIYSTYLYQVPDPDDETAVEYTRTDAFIEKACDWLADNYSKYIITYGLATIFRPTIDFDTIRMIENFKKAMED